VLTWVLIGALVLSSGGVIWAVIAANAGQATPEPVKTTEPATPTPEPAPEPVAEPEPEPEPAPQWDIDSPSSITVVVNKQRPLNPIDWAPDDLVWPNVPNNNGQPMRAEAAQAIESMYAAALADGAPFVIASGYRDYATQVGLFDSYVQRDGVEAAETYSARPGHSEHQTGLVADVDDGSGCTFDVCFGNTAAGTWVRENAHRFGFIVRYNQDQQGVTGYIYEPYHLRYVGPQVAGEMHAQGIVNLEDFFGLPAAPTY
jgi:D-alanyl-D-alanine carboxypeptidase